MYDYKKHISSMNRKKLLAYIADKNGALEFWKDLRPQVDYKNKIQTLKNQIQCAYNKIKGGGKT